MPTPANPPLDPAQIHAQAAALAAHLQRSGVAFLPIADAAKVESMVPQFGSAEPAAVAANTPANAHPPVPRTDAQPQASQSQASQPQTSQTQSTQPKAIGPKGSLREPRPPKKRLETVPAVAADESDYSGPTLSPEERISHLEILAGEVSNCNRCEILSSCRTRTVFGEGNAQARFLFFGEGPGADEDRSGRPFVGKAGQLLTKMIAACTLDRADCYITNTVKCRPPGNRNPELDEIQNCRSYYQKQFDLIRPEYIVCLGAVAASELLSTKLSVGRLRGKLHQYRGSKVLVTYHPAYLLRNPAAKKAAWEDLQLLLADAGIKL
jgi:DNA polymerase